MPYKIVLEKENFKFSCSHFTIFGEATAERLHGHNYYVSVELSVADIPKDRGYAFDFNTVKPLVREITAAFDEYVLLPRRSPHLQVTTEGPAVRARFANKQYEFPLTDVKLLDIVNVTAEELARLIAQELAAKLGSGFTIDSLAVGVEETRGQGVVYTMELGRP